MTTTIDFNNLSSGTVVDNEFVSDGVTISAVGGSGQAMIFDTAHPTGDDHDLATSNLGKVLIISEDGDAHDPDDNAGGGRLFIDFDTPSDVKSLTVLDVEEGAWIKLLDQDGNLLSQVDVFTPNNGQKVVHLNQADVARIEVVLAGSGAIDNLVFEPGVASPAGDGVVDGEGFGEEMVLGYDDSNAPTDQGGDMITNGDDVIFGNGGNDTIDGAGGNDTIYGDDGNDAEREVLRWSEAPGFSDENAATNFSQDTGNVTVDVQITSGARDPNDVDVEFSTDAINVDGVDTGGLGAANQHSTLDVFSTDATAEARVELNFSDPVENVSFRIADLDFDASFSVFAFDAQGNPVSVSFVNAGENVARVDDQAGIDQFETVEDLNRGSGEDSTSNTNSVGVEIAGPVSQIVLVYDAQGGQESSTHISDIYFDADIVGPGEPGDDVISGGDGDDKIFGEEGNDTLQGDAGSNYVSGGAGDDIFIGGEGADTFHGGSGQDNIDYSGSDAAVNVDLADLTVSGGDGDNDSIVGGIDGIIGSEFDDTLRGFDFESTNSADSFTNEFFGEGGNDILEGRGGGDLLSGGADNDTIFAGAGDTVDGGAGGTDFDILDLTGQGPFIVQDQTPDSNGNGTNGTIVFVDADGTPNGETLTFTEIEEIRGAFFNSAPDAMDDTATTNEDTPVTIPVLANDVDADGDPLTVTEATSPDGEVTINGDGSITFTPNENFNGPATITYTVTDPSGASDTATVDINVTPVNDAPDAINDVAETAEETPITIDALANDVDVDGDPLVITGASVPADTGTVEVVDNQLVFTPAENFNGVATISYAISDGNGGTDTATVDVTVTPVNDDPVAVDDAVETDEDTPVVVDLVGNDTDVDGDPLTIGSVSVPADQGTVTDNGDGTVTFTPAPNFNGPATITYTVIDGQGGEDEGEAVVSVGAVNDGPVAADDTATTDEDTPVTIDVLGNDQDPDGDPLTIVGASVPADQGTVEIVDNQLVFTPAENFNGDVVITYTVTDGNGGTDTGDVDVVVTPVNDDPVAVDDIETTDEDTPVVIDLLGNDVDADGDPLSLGSVSVPPEQGSVVDNGDGTVTFTPALNFNGPATITYTVVDGQGGEDEGEAIVSVGAVNDSPEAMDDSDTTPEDTPITVDVLANDVDPDGDALTVISAVVPADQGTAEINPDNSVTFTPAPNFTGEATITYTVSDGNGGTDTADHVITVVSENDAPDAMDDMANAIAGQPVTIDALANDVDPDGDMLTIIDATVPAEQGVVEIVDNQVVFTPTPGFEGPATIAYTIEDEDGLTDDAVITVDVRNGIVNGTDAGELIDETFLGDPGGDLIDAGDAILPGEAPDDDIVQAGGGNDTILSGDGSDEVFGGAGDDVIDAGNGDLNVDKGFPGLFPGEEGTPATEDDRDFVDGGAGDDTISTGDDADTIVGGSGEDVIDGGIDDDSIDGGTEDDRIVGGEGNDFILGGDGDDAIFAGNDPDLGLDALDIEDDGSNPFGPDLRPDNGRDTVFGGDGNDTIFGADDDDQLFGEDGDDVIDGQIDDDLLDGGAGDDTLLGGQGDDTIVGGAGNDLIDAGPDGDDSLSGGADRDTFVNVDAGDVVDGGGDGDDFDTLDLRGSAPEDGSLSVTITGPDSNGNGFDGFVTYFDENGDPVGDPLVFSDIENVIPCFTPGTKIATSRGEVKVEDLVVGDRVVTRDNGIQAIRWVGHRKMTGMEFAAAPHLKPVRIRRGALGMALPERDMMVSPNHRVLVANDKTELFFEEREVLVAAKHLTAMDGIDIVDINWTTYIHVMFDQHEVILSDGAWTESFQPGDMTLGSMGDAQREEILELFPELRTPEGIEAYTAARRSLKKHEAKLLSL